MISFLLLALTHAHSPAKAVPWVPAQTEQENQTCGIGAHEHSFLLDDRGHYVIEKEMNEPDVVFDGKCHDNDDEHVIIPPEDRKILPKPVKPEAKL